MASIAMAQRIVLSIVAISFLILSSSAKADDPVFRDLRVAHGGGSPSPCEYWMPRLRGA
jgi:hypothetical protein